jgi:hypothetical protein
MILDYHKTKLTHPYIGYKAEKLSRKKWKRDRIFYAFKLCGACNKSIFHLTKRHTLYVMRKVYVDYSMFPLVDICCSEPCVNLYILSHI